MSTVLQVSLIWLHPSTKLCPPGFKFIGNVALQLEKEGYSVPFGYEEAIGYMISSEITTGNEIRDKDGVTATVCGRSSVRTDRPAAHRDP